MSQANSDPIDAAIRHHQAGRFDAAESGYLGILAEDPEHHESLHLLGLLAHQRGEADQAIALIGRALSLCSSAAPYHNNLGNALRAAGRLAEAADALATAWALRPASAEIANNLGSMLTDLRRWPEAIRTLREAVALDPSLPEAHYNLANALCGAGDAEAALAVYGDCLRLRPHSADAHFNLGHALASLGRGEAAASRYRAALRIDPTYAAAHNNLGALLRDADQVEAAAACFAEALRLRPADHAVACNLGSAYLATGHVDAASACFERVLAAAPDHGAALLGHLMSHLPVTPRDADEIAAGRAAYAAELARLIERADRPSVQTELAVAAGGVQPFFLPYQGCDDRALQQAYGGLMHALAPPPARLPASPKQAERLRVGIMSGFFRDHTVWTLFLQGWLTQLDPARFRLFGYHTGARRDACTDLAAARCERFVEGARSSAAWRAEILADAPHVLLYPEIGMDPLCARLAAQRLAPLQCVAWGHPVTTGLPTIDWFLSGALMEPGDASSHYSERLAALPNLGVFCEPAGPPPRPRRSEFGLRPGAVVYWSGQNLPKYHPDDDEAFARIAAEIPDSQFVFIAFGHGGEMTRRFSDRLARAFARHGLDAARHCVILPQMPQERFLAAAASCDVVLDTIGWSGGKSTLDLLAIDPAIVTLPGRFMRGRHTAAILERIGAVRTVARGVDDYVAIAIRLGRDPVLRDSVRAEVARGKHLVFRDRSAIEALEAHLLEAFRPIPPPGRSAGRIASATGSPAR